MKCEICNSVGIKDTCKICGAPQKVESLSIEEKSYYALKSISKNIALIAATFRISLAIAIVLAFFFIVIPLMANL